MIGEQDQEYAEAVAEDIEKLRRKFMDEFYALSGEAFFKLGRREKGLIRTWQTSTRLVAPEERKLVGLTEQEIVLIEAIPTLHLWSETSACRNISDEQIRQRQHPTFVTVSAGYVFCFDSVTELGTSMSGNLIAKIPIQIQPSQFVYLELALTGTECSIARYRNVSTFSPPQKRNSDEIPASPPKKQQTYPSTSRSPAQTTRPSLAPPPRSVINLDPPEADDFPDAQFDDDPMEDEDWKLAMALQSSLWENDAMQID